MTGTVLKLLITAAVVLFFCCTLQAQMIKNITNDNQAPQAEEKVFRSIGPVEALRMLQSRNDVLFLDVRTAKERSYGAIPGSELVSIYPLLKGDIPLPKDKAILLVCAVGGRSYMAGQVLSGKGYREVYNLSGGVKGWHKAGLPLTYDEAAVKK
ncbi:MAG: rhodanese-like domain-containing protein [Desulfobulbaceae bacterium]|nr:rhodanese-like domain-containing protein [Desulfobulbaceae bacterium]